jgi:hypothetical protein
MGAFDDKGIHEISNLQFLIANEMMYFLFFDIQSFHWKSGIGDWGIIFYSVFP